LRRGEREDSETMQKGEKRRMRLKSVEGKQATGKMKFGKK